MTTLIPLEIECRFCGEFKRRLVDFQDYLDWVDGKSTQEAFPYLSPIQREIFITAMCEDCCETMYKMLEQWEDDEDE